MALHFVGGIILGQVAGELKELTKKTMVEVIYFRPFLEKLQSTLEFLTPLLEEVDRLNERITDRPKTHIQKLKEELVKGTELVRKCPNVSIWNCFIRWWYSRQILKLQKALLEFFPMTVTADIWFICQKTLVEARERESRMMSLGSGSEVACAAPVPDTLIFGLDFSLKELKKLLFELEEGPRVIGLCAPGGSGKTTLAVKLFGDEEVKDTFKNIFFLTVLSSPDLKEMVKKLFQQLKNQVTTFRDDEDAKRQLGNLLEREQPNNTLLVLDDVWDELVIQKFVFMVKGYKILVTSRTNYGSFNYKYSVRMLSEPHDTALFCHWAILQYREGNHEEATIQEIVSGCKGHPLALRLIGCSLRQQPAAVWREKKELVSSCSILKSHDDLLKCLGSSFNCLNKNVHECFLDLGAFPKDQRIPASSLIDIWVELYGIDEVVAYCNLHELSTRTLVNMFELARGEAGEIHGNMNKLFVAQHGLLRELAIYQSRQQGTRLIMERRGDSLPSIWRQQKDRFRNIRLVSIQTGEEFSSNWFDMHFPKAEVLILDCFAKKYTLPPFMKKMKKLKVLIIVNHGHYHTKLSYSTKVGHLSCLKRVRLEKVLVSSLNEIKKPLKNLQKISLLMCEVAQALSNCNFNIPLMLPNLVEIDIDYCNDVEELPQGICDLIHVKNLSITNCHELSALLEKIGCMRDLEVLRLHACTKLSKLPDSLGELQKLSFLDISDCLSMELPEWIGELGNLRTLNMKGCPEPRELPHSAMELVHLHNLICDGGTKYIWESLKLPELKNIIVSKDINLLWLGI